MTRFAGHVDYDAIAATYDQRYEHAYGDGAGTVAGLLRGLSEEHAVRRLLETGCGTGHWLEKLAPLVPLVVGLDPSSAMLGLARARCARLPLVRGTAVTLPFRSRSFSAIVCVNALHHFEAPCAFIDEARRCLDDDGRLVVIGMDPHTRRDRWYLWDCFPGTREADLERFPSAATIAGWMRGAGFGGIEVATAERLSHDFVGRDVLDDPTLHRRGTSQLALLSDDAYATGVNRIRARLAAAERDGTGPPVFRTDVALTAVIGRRLRVVAEEPP